MTPATRLTRRPLGREQFTFGAGVLMVQELYPAPAGLRVQLAIQSCQESNSWQNSPSRPEVELHPWASLSVMGCMYVIQ